MSALSYRCPGVLDDATDVEFTREERLAWLESEFAGYDPEPLVVDEAGETEIREELFSFGCTLEEVDEIQPGPIEVPEWERSSCWDTNAHLGRVWRGAYLHSFDGGRTVKGANPFSVDEGASEWLQRARIEMRQLYREAKSDPERAAIRAREAALRARHNARCFARAFAAYWQLDAKDVCRMLDGWQKQNPIGWLGLEAAMRSMLQECKYHFCRAHLDWQNSFPVGSWIDGSITQEAKDAWLDREPVAPLYPTQLVTSVKAIRRYTPERETAPTGVPSDFKVASAKRVSKLQRDRQRRERVAEAISKAKVAVTLPVPLPDTEWFAVRKEWERAEMVEPEKLTVPENYPCDWLLGDLTLPA